MFVKFHKIRFELLLEVGASVVYELSLTETLTLIILFPSEVSVDGPW